MRFDVFHNLIGVFPQKGGFINMKNYENIIKNMNIDSSIKIYSKVLKSLVKNDIDIVEKIYSCNYYFSYNGIEYCYHSNEINDSEKIIDWISSLHKNSSQELEFSNGLQVLELKNETIDDMIFVNAVNAFCNEYKDIAINIYHEVYHETLILKSGIVQERKIEYIIIIFKKLDKDIINLIYDYNITYEELMKELINEYNKYKRWNNEKCFSIEDAVYDGAIECITAPKVAGMLLHESIAHTLEADVYCDLQKKGMAVRKNEKLSHPALCVKDIPRYSNISTSIYYDDVGTEAKSVIQVQNGVIINLLDDGTFDIGEKCGCLRGSFDNSELQIRMRNTVVDNGYDDFGTMISSLKKGIYIEDADNSYRKDSYIFLHLRRAYLIKDGECIGRVQDSLLKCEYRYFLKNVSSIASNAKWETLYHCTKNAGTIFISNYTPSIKCIMMEA